MEAANRAHAAELAERNRLLEQARARESMARTASSDQITALETRLSESTLELANSGEIVRNATERADALSAELEASRAELRRIQQGTSRPALPGSGPGL